MARCRCSESKLATGDFVFLKGKRGARIISSSPLSKTRADALTRLFCANLNKDGVNTCTSGHMDARKGFFCVFPTGYKLFSPLPPPLPRSPLPLPLKSKMQTSSDVAEYTIRVPQRAMMSSTQKLWESVIQGQQNKAANRDSKYITAHFSPPELNWQR